MCIFFSDIHLPIKCHFDISMPQFMQCCQDWHQTSNTCAVFRIYKPSFPHILQLWWAYQFCLCLFLGLEATLVSRIKFIDSVSLLSAGGAQSQARLPQLQSFVRNAGEMVQLINSGPVQFNSTQGLFMPVIDPSWRAVLCSLEIGFFEGKMVKLK